MKGSSFMHIPILKYKPEIVVLCTEKFNDLSAIKFLPSLEYPENIGELGVVLG
jgi:hypothetical protein